MGTSNWRWTIPSRGSCLNAYRHWPCPNPHDGLEKRRWIPVEASYVSDYVCPGSQRCSRQCSQTTINAKKMGHNESKMSEYVYECLTFWYLTISAVPVMVSSWMEYMWYFVSTFQPRSSSSPTFTSITRKFVPPRSSARKSPTSEMSHMNKHQQHHES